MSKAINGKTYYRTAEACQIADISRSTFFRWLRQGSFQDVENFDRRGRGAFSEGGPPKLKTERKQKKTTKF